MPQKGYFVRNNFVLNYHKEILEITLNQLTSVFNEIKIYVTIIRLNVSLF